MFENFHIMERVNYLLLVSIFVFQFTDVLLLVIVPRLQKEGRVIKNTVKIGKYA